MSGYDCRNRWVFSLWRNVVSDGADWTWTGRLFQSRGPAVANERSPTVTSRDGRTSRRLDWRSTSAAGLDVKHTIPVDKTAVWPQGNQHMLLLYHDLNYTIMTNPTRITWCAKVNDVARFRRCSVIFPGNMASRDPCSRGTWCKPPHTMHLCQFLVRPQY